MQLVNTTADPPAQREPRPDGVARHPSLIVAATGYVALTIG